MKYCDIIVRADKLYIFANFETQPSVRLSGQPLTIIDKNVDLDMLGCAVLKTLDAYKSGVPHPNKEEMKELERADLIGTGYKSWSELTKKSVCLFVEQDDASISVIPSQKVRGGVVGVRDKLLKSTTDPVELAQVINNAIKLCR